MNNYKKLKLCVIGNVSVLLFVFILAVVFRDGSKYWNIGPNDNLYIISVRIDNSIKYFLLLLVIAIVNSSKTIIDSIGFSITNFNTYNPDKKMITEFSKNELQMATNMMSFTRNLREIFIFMATISQIDIAFFSVLIIELTNIYTVRMILNNKKFTKKSPPLNSCLDSIDIISNNVFRYNYTDNNEIIDNNNHHNYHNSHNNHNNQITTIDKKNEKNNDKIINKDVEIIDDDDYEDDYEKNLL